MVNTFLTGSAEGVCAGAGLQSASEKIAATAIPKYFLGLLCTIIDSSFRNVLSVPRSIHLRLLASLCWRVVQPFHQLHAALAKFLVRKSLPRPALHNLVHSVAFLAPEPVIHQIRDLNPLPDHPYPP